MAPHGPALPEERPDSYSAEAWSALSPWASTAPIHLHLAMRAAGAFDALRRARSLGAIVVGIAEGAAVLGDGASDDGAGGGSTSGEAANGGGASGADGTPDD